MIYFNMSFKFLFQIRIFTFLIGREVGDSRQVRWMACNNKGNNEPKCIFNACRKFWSSNMRYMSAGVIFQWEIVKSRNQTCVFSVKDFLYLLECLYCLFCISRGTNIQWNLSSLGDYCYARISVLKDYTFLGKDPHLGIIQPVVRDPVHERLQFCDQCFVILHGRFWQNYFINFIME